MYWSYVQSPCLVPGTQSAGVTTCSSSDVVVISVLPFAQGKGAIHSINRIRIEILTKLDSTTSIHTSGALSILLFFPTRRPIPLLRRPTSRMFPQKLFSRLLLGNNIGSFVSHRSPLAST